MRTKPCKGCKSPVEILDLFPGQLCLGCYAASEEGRKPLSAESVSEMWKGVVR